MKLLHTHMLLIRRRETDSTRLLMLNCFQLVCPAVSYGWPDADIANA